MSVSRETLAESVSRETLARLDVFAELLAKWNPQINLISRGDLVGLWSRHIADLLQLRALIPHTATTAFDLGSGGGFPGLVLAIATEVKFTLVEADSRKATFLREAARLTGTQVEILNSRIETVRAEPAPLITARALAPLAQLLKLATPLLSPGGTLLLLKGAQADAEIAEARRAWTLTIEQHISQTGGGGVILRISEVQRA